MIKELEKLLQKDYQYAIEAQIEDDAEAETARKAGEMSTYFDLARHLQLADLCWALEKWDEAKHWYRHNAQVLMERRAWRAGRGGPEAQSEGISDWEATTIIKAGDLDAGKNRLQKAIVYWRTQPDSDLVLTQLGLHAAQIGLPELATYSRAIKDARQELPGSDNSLAAQKARKLLHYEPAQVNLMLGRWDEFQKNIAEVVEGAQVVEGKPGLAFPEYMQDALIAASRGLKTLASIYSREIDPTNGQKEARQAFEEAMLNFYHFSGQIDWNLYFMRLNTCFADQLAVDQTLNTNPFADGWMLERP